MAACLEAQIGAINDKTMWRLDRGHRMTHPTETVARRDCEMPVHAVAAHIAEYVYPVIDISAHSWEAGCELELVGSVVKVARTPSR